MHTSGSHHNRTVVTSDWKGLGGSAKRITYGLLPSEPHAQVYHICTPADYLASQAGGPFVESTSALHPCKECDWMTNHGGKLDRPTTVGKRRTLKELREFLKHARQLHGVEGTATMLKDAMQSRGVNKLFYALDSDYIPYSDCIRDLPPDIMHLFLCGLSRHELAWMIDIFRKEKYFTLEQLNERIKLIELPYGKRVPKIVAESGKNQKSRRKMKLDMTATETMYFVKASLTVFEGLLTVEQRKHPAWLSWLLHREVFIMCIQQEFKRIDAEVLKKKIDAYLEAFEKVCLYIALTRSRTYP